MRLDEVAITLREGDTVAVCRRPLAAGEEFDDAVGTLRARQAVPAGHKVALQDVPAGAPVLKYGHAIGYAVHAIARGDWVHNHNLNVGPLTPDYAFGTEIVEPRPIEPGDARTFMGYARPDGRVGTRNCVAIVAASNCAADTVRMLADRINRELAPDVPGFDGALAVTHSLGCGMALGGEQHRLLQRCLGGLATHPNIGASIIVGLGCEVNQADEMVRTHGLVAPQTLGTGRGTPPPVLVIQQAGGVRRTVEEGLRLAVPLVRRLAGQRRTPQPLSALTVGTNCGGSDAYSGITANPALGAAGDVMVRHGAAWVLAETPETYGAEHLLTRRAATREVGEKLVALMRWWERYTAMYGAEINNNPAPGNKEGGISTIYEKSLGAVMKGGTSPLRAVYAYAEQVRAAGLSFMDTPGHDPTSVTGLVCGGCNLVAFTTGRGSCLGFRGVPVLKIATSTGLYERMPYEMDVNAGTVLDGMSVRSMGQRVVDEIAAVASGKRTRAEEEGLGDHTFAPWELGPVL